LAQGLYDITPLEPLIREGRVLLTPNSRLARRIVAEWDTRCIAAGQQTWEPPAVLPLESWLLQQWELAISLGLLNPVTPLNPAQEIELWRQVIGEQERESNDYHLLRPGSAAETASQARDTLLRWQVDFRDRHIRQLFNLERDCDTFLRWLTEYERRLAEAGQCAIVDCLAQLPNLTDRLPALAVALVEFDELQPLMSSALTALCQDVCEIKSTQLPGNRVAQSFSEPRVELQAVAVWAGSLHRTDPSTTIGIVLTDMAGSRVPLEYLLRREFNCLGANYNDLPVNFSAGIPLAQAPLIHDALEVLAIGLQHTTVSAVMHLLHSRFIVSPDAESTNRQRLITGLYKDGREVLSLQDLQYAVNKASSGKGEGLELGKYLLALSRMRELQRVMRPSEWVSCFRDVLSVWGWPGKPSLDSLEFQQLDLWHRTLDEFRAFDAVCGPINFAAALQLLRDNCHRQISQPQTDDSPVQVLGILEAAGLNFEHLWVCGMQATCWPESPRPSPFIPVSLQKRLRMPHATSEREWAFSEALLGQYVRSCQMLHASYACQIDGVTDMPSPLLTDFTQQPISEPPMVNAQWGGSQLQRNLETLSDDVGPCLLEENFSAVKGGSALIEDQSQCPFRAFARRRMLVEPLPALSETISSAERGALLHDALFALWSEIKDSASLGALASQQEEEVVARAVKAAVQLVSSRKRYSLGVKFWMLESQAMAKVLHKWLAVERQRSEFYVEALEQDINLELAQLPIRLRVDRIDQLPDGSRVIIDYKSGECSARDWLGTRPAKPQLLLYASAEPDSVAALAFAKVRTRQPGYAGLGRVIAAPGISTELPRTGQVGTELEDWPTLNEYWRENLEQLAQSFVDGAAAVDPLSPSSCTWCGLQPLCRVDISEKAPMVEGQ
jgi:ATP-dependent helicase/nuclease subunit B